MPPYCTRSWRGKKIGERIDQDIAQQYSQISDRKLKLLKGMVNDVTGYGSFKWSGKHPKNDLTREGTDHTKLSLMRAYVRAFGEPEEAARATGDHPNKLEPQELHAINIRNAKAMIQSFRHLDQVTGSKNPRASRGIEKLMHYRGSPAQQERVDVDLTADTTAPVAPVRRQAVAILEPVQENQEVDDTGVVYHKTTHTKGAPVGSSAERAAPPKVMVAGIEELGPRAPSIPAQEIWLDFESTPEPENWEADVDWDWDAPTGAVPEPNASAALNYIASNLNLQFSGVSESTHRSLVENFERNIAAVEKADPQIAAQVRKLWTKPLAAPDVTGDREVVARSKEVLRLRRVLEKQAAPELQGFEGTSAYTAASPMQFKPRVASLSPPRLRPAVVKREIVARGRVRAAAAQRRAQDLTMSDRQRQQSLIAQPSTRAFTEHTSYNHMIEGDLAPVGRVPGPSVSSTS